MRFQCGLSHSGRERIIFHSLLSCVCHLAGHIAPVIGNLGYLLIVMLEATFASTMPGGRKRWVCRAAFGYQFFVLVQVYLKRTVFKLVCNPWEVEGTRNWQKTTRRWLEDSLPEPTGRQTSRPRRQRLHRRLRIDHLPSYLLFSLCRSLPVKVWFGFGDKSGWTRGVLRVMPES